MNTTPQHPTTGRTQDAEGKRKSMIAVAANAFLIGGTGTLAEFFAVQLLLHTISRRLKAEGLITDTGLCNYSFSPFVSQWLVTDHHAAARVTIDEITALEPATFLHWTVGVFFPEEGDNTKEFWRVVGCGAWLGQPVPPHDLNKLAHREEISRQAAKVLAEVEATIREVFPKVTQ